MWVSIVTRSQKTGPFPLPRRLFTSYERVSFVASEHTILLYRLRVLNEIPLIDRVIIGKIEDWRENNIGITADKVNMQDVLSSHRCVLFEWFNNYDYYYCATATAGGAPTFGSIIKPLFL